MRKYVNNNEYEYYIYYNMEHIIMSKLSEEKVSSNPDLPDDCKLLVLKYHECYKENSKKPKSCLLIKDLLNKIIELKCSW